MKLSVRQSLFAYFDTQGERVITGWQLFAIMESRTGKKTYPETLLGYLRDYCDISAADLECIDATESKYHFVPGYKISGALDYGKE